MEITTIATGQCTLHHATVLERNDYLHYVEHADSIVAARRALGCLVEPEQGDTVLISIQNNQAFILSVLSRSTVSDTTISVPGNLHMQATEGSIDLQSKSIELNAADSTHISSSKISLDALQADINISRLSYWGTIAECYCEKFKLMGEAMESFFKRVFHHAEHAQRHIDQTELVRCKNLNYEADNMLQLRGKIAHISAPEDIHVHGERVHLG
jgi:hypothetical protein